VSQITCWRITRAVRQHVALDGVGAAYNGGRWNPIGVKMVYCAQSLALAVLEIRVHLAMARPKERFVGLEVAMVESAVECSQVSDLPRSWQRSPQASTSDTAARRFGARWIREQRSVALQVPSAVIPSESIFLLNPEHPDFNKSVRLVRTLPVTLDPRLWDPASSGTT
jgi:RES domain-containing protein